MRGFCRCLHLYLNTCIQTPESRYRFPNTASPVSLRLYDDDDDVDDDDDYDDDDDNDIYIYTHTYVCVVAVASPASLHIGDG